MAKGSKKYASHEYDMVKGGPALKEHKDKALELRKDSKTYPRKMADGGSISAGISASAASGGVPHTTPAGSTLGAIQSMGAAFGGKHAKGGEVKKKKIMA